MVKRNENFGKLQAGYLFRTIAEKKQAYTAANPTAKLISLGIGDTTHPIPPFICKAMTDAAAGLGTKEGYSGYPDWNGRADTRALIAEKFYNNVVTPDEVIISDGSKPDLCRLQFLFPEGTPVALQDPVYPAPLDGSVIAGKTGIAEGEKKHYGNVTYLVCNPENNFFPDLTKLEKKAQVIFFCSPNNPTGVVATREQLTQLVAFAKETNSIIVFDSAYRAFITDDSLPKSIYEIEGAKDVALETSSFSKLVGFTGVRLGWTVCPKSVKFECGSSVYEDWKRIMGTFFNGPSNVAEAGGFATMQPEGQKEMDMLIKYYMANGQVIGKILKEAGFAVYGGTHSPYLWVKAPNGKTSWDIFDMLLNECSIVTTPGVGFGSQGEGFFRISCFASHEQVEEASERLKGFFDSDKWKAAIGG